MTADAENVLSPQSLLRTINPISFSRHCTHKTDFDKCRRISYSACKFSAHHILLLWLLTHLCLAFHYWNGCYVGVIYILLLRVITESDFFSHVCFLRVHVITWCTVSLIFFHTFASWGYMLSITWCTVSHCYRSCHAGSLSKKWCEFLINFFNNHPLTGKYNFTALHPILVIFFLLPLY
jgi:hypothetical protein